MRRLGFVALSLWCVSCSWLVGANEKAARCSTEEDATPCEAGYECREGRCVRNDAALPGCDVEVCGNQRDDDCDGETDERVEGGTDRCGDMDDNDCDGKVDEDPDTKRAEACGNSIDDDCDGRTDEVPDADRPEACGNHADDDCDGKVDEGHDQDQDGNQWCGDTRTVEGMQLIDCDDYDPDVYHDAPERCDGADNDCDGTVDESDASSLCDPGEECVAQRCVVPSCAVLGSSEECEDDEMCDLNTGKCQPKGCSDAECKVLDPLSYCDVTSGECRTERRNNGDECAASGDCKSGSCIDAAALRLVSSAARVCGEACCSDLDCSEGQRCFVSGSGARSCLPVSLTPDPGGASSCTNDAQCPGAQVCAVRTAQSVEGPGTEPRDDLITTVCVTPPGNAFAPGADCLNNADCASSACVFDPFDAFFDVCSAICRTSDDCLEVQQGASSSASSHSYCRYLEATAGSVRGDYVPVCVMESGPEAGTGDILAPCSSGSQCLDGACVGAGSGSLGECAPTCCSDAQCPSVDGTDTFCRPIAFGGHYEMRCVR